jgi:DNA-binding GntR family transcriptional regulator
LVGWRTVAGSKIHDASGDSPREYQTMAELAFRRLRDAVMQGTLQPGDRVPQEQVAAELGISRMPLREALRRLEERGFVTIRPHRGAYVTPLSVRHMNELYVARTLLESANAGEAARRMQDATLRELRELLDGARDALKAADGLTLADLNRRFHLVGHKASGNEVMLNLISDLSIHCQRYRLMHASLSQRAATALDEHEKILDAWTRRDSDAARRWTAVNLRNSRAALAASLGWSDEDAQGETDELEGLVWIGAGDPPAS